MSLILPFPPTQTWTPSVGPSVLLSGRVPLCTSPRVPPESKHPSFSLPGHPSPFPGWAPRLPGRGPGELTQNVIRMRSLACLNPAVTFHPCEVQSTFVVWSCHGSHFPPFALLLGTLTLPVPGTHQVCFSPIGCFFCVMPSPPPPLAMLASSCHSGLPSNVISLARPFPVNPV